MARLSQRWQDSILQSRNQSCGQSVLDSTFPIMPWITPALDPKLEALILRIGARRNFEPGELLFAKDQKIDQLAIVCRGVTARGIGNFSQYAVGLATPGRIAAGNLNFFRKACHRQVFCADNGRGLFLSSFSAVEHTAAR